MTQPESQQLEQSGTNSQGQSPIFACHDLLFLALCGLPTGAARRRRANEMGHPAVAGVAVVADQGVMHAGPRRRVAGVGGTSIAVVAIDAERVAAQGRDPLAMTWRS